jgi:hypothetical protein
VSGVCGPLNGFELKFRDMKFEAGASRQQFVIGVKISVNCACNKCKNVFGN